MQVLNEQEVAQNVQKIAQDVREAALQAGRDPSEVQVMAVTKTVDPVLVNAAIGAGITLLGENKAQELCAKYDSYHKDGVQIHFIGHLQTNKVKYIVPYVALIHGIDSFKLLAEVDKQAAKVGRRVDCLLQLHIAREETKFGFSFDECRQMLAEGQWRQLQHIRLCGLMGMATNTDNVEQIKEEFRSLSNFFREVKSTWFADDDAFCELSMGMSHDYHEAIAEGSTLVRVGSKIFGERIY